MKHDFVPGDNHILCSKCGYGRYDSNHYIISMPQEQTFEEWRALPKTLELFGGRAPHIQALMHAAAKSAWNAAKGEKA